MSDSYVPNPADREHAPYVDRKTAVGIGNSMLQAAADAQQAATDRRRVEQEAQLQRPLAPGGIESVPFDLTTNTTTTPVPEMITTFPPSTTEGVTLPPTTSTTEIAPNLPVSTTQAPNVQIQPTTLPPQTN